MGAKKRWRDLPREARTALAFFFAPLATAPVFLLYLFAGRCHPIGGIAFKGHCVLSAALGIAASSLLAAYFFEVILAVPIFMFLKHHKWDSIWSAAIVGAVLPGLFLLLVNDGVPASEFALTAVQYAPVGIVPALLFWLLARPLPSDAQQATD